MCVRTLVLLTAIGWSVPALGAEAPAPPVVVQLRSLDSLLQDVGFLLKSAGQEEAAQQFDSFIKIFLGGKAGQALDLQKPLGLYVLVGPQFVDSAFVVLVPIRNEQ